MNKLTGTLVYVQVQRPVKAYVKPGTPAKPDEWKASIVIADEDVIDEYEKYAKDLDAMVSIKKVKTAEFSSLYKTDPPKDSGKNVWVVTLRKSTELGKTGKPVPDQYKPRVFEKMGNKIVDVTNTKLPANGSEGAISIDLFTRTNGTSSLYLKNVLVTKMVEYVPDQEYVEYEAGQEFDVADDGQGNTVNVPASASSKKISVKQKSKEEEEEDFPF